MKKYSTTPQKNNVSFFYLNPAIFFAGLFICKKKSSKKDVILFYDNPYQRSAYSSNSS